MSAPNLVAELATERERHLYGFCIYCARPTRGLSCAAHRDLLILDPNQYEMRVRPTSNDRPGTSLRGAPEPAVN